MSLWSINREKDHFIRSDEELNVVEAKTEKFYRAFDGERFVHCQITLSSTGWLKFQRGIFTFWRWWFSRPVRENLHVVADFFVFAKLFIVPAFRSSTCDERGHPPHDPLFKVHSIVDLIIQCFIADYGRCKELSLDEITISFKGSSTLKVENLKQPDKLGDKALNPLTKFGSYYFFFSFITIWLYL